MGNLDIYNKVRAVPAEAKKAISGGRMSGKTDINPMWRIKALTENFGVCGIGWKYEIVKFWLENGGNDEVSAFAEIKLYIKSDGEWSDGIPGIGGSSFVAKENKGLFTSDECYKMALTDAISVACKALGVGADVYWDKDSTKYDKSTQTPQKSTTPTQQNSVLSEAQLKRIFAIAKLRGFTTDDVKTMMITNFKIESTKDLTKEQYETLCNMLEKLTPKQEAE